MLLNTIETVLRVRKTTKNGRTHSNQHRCNSSSIYVEEKTDRGCI